MKEGTSHTRMSATVVKQSNNKNERDAPSLLFYNLLSVHHYITIASVAAHDTVASTSCRRDTSIALARPTHTVAAATCTF
jgi:hypothetical protein